MRNPRQSRFINGGQIPQAGEVLNVLLECLVHARQDILSRSPFGHVRYHSTGHAGKPSRKLLPRPSGQDEASKQASHHAEQDFLHNDSFPKRLNEIWKRYRHVASLRRQYTSATKGGQVGKITLTRSRLGGQRPGSAAACRLKPPDHHTTVYRFWGKQAPVHSGRGLVRGFQDAGGGCAAKSGVSC